MTEIFGGSTYTTMTATRTGLQRIRALSAAGRMPFEGKLLTDPQVVDEFSREMGLSGIAVHVLSGIHDQIAQLYVRIIDEWRRTHPTDAVRIGLAESRDARPPNYTEAMTRLRNTSWVGYVPDFGGFCHREPVVRILQLARYPITQFVAVSIDTPVVPVPPRPAVPPSVAGPVTYERLESLRSHFEARERWMVELCRALDTVPARIASARIAVRLD